MISQITPAGIEPGEPREIDRGFGLPGAHEHAASRARSGKVCPGRRKSAGSRVGIEQSRIVAARSCAEMPVVVTPRASTETVNAVPWTRRVVAHHLRNVQLVEPLAGHRHADQAAGLACA